MHFPSSNDIHDATRKVEDIAHKVEDTASYAAQQACEVASSASNAVYRTTDNLVCTVREKPIRSAAAALGVGFIMGMFCSSRHGDEEASGAKKKTRRAA